MNSICRILTTFRGAALRNGLYSGMSPHKTDTIVIDPTGDVLLTLKNPDAGFAVWTQDSAEASISDLENAEVQDTDEETDEDDADDEDTLVEEEFASRSKRKRRTTMDRKDRKRQQRGIFSRTSSSSTIENASDIPKPAVTYQVSSRHLITASPKFKSDLMLYGEGAKGEDGFFHLSTTDWDPDAFAILLNMLHLRYRHVPRELSLEKLAKVAMLVDYYRCWEAFDLISSVWIAHLRKMYTVPATYSRELVLWILISWVFKLSPEFTEATAKALRQCKEPCIRDLKLGIPPIILQTMESRRSKAIAEVFANCNSWLEKFCDTYQCKHNTSASFECSSMLLGALTKGMKRLDMLSPRPIPPFDGISLEAICKQIKLMKSPTCHTQRPHSSAREEHICSLQGTLFPDIDAVLNHTKGLVLADFVHGGEEAVSKRR